MTNKLAKESSSYLRQHADNPVDWYPWSKEAFHRALVEDKPIFLSVGYAACHWCHVMAHESFENPEIARLLNERFISIKVDRQERPDVDELYQKVVQMQGQGGGWPLSVFMTPQGEPFFGGTYFPPQDRYGRPGFLSLLLGVSAAWQHHRQALSETIQQFLQGYQTLDDKLLQGKIPMEEDLPAKAAQFFANHTDLQYGGLGDAPKFPNPLCYDLVLRVYQRTRESALLSAVELTLDSMAAGGIYDQLGGGFARYSVDQRWAVPHFEKMLYDNGQLVKLYADAYRLTGKPFWRQIFEETIAYVLRDMTHAEGAFYASEDADSEGEEGKFYVWTPAEIRTLLGETEGDFVCSAYGVTPQGNFEQGNTVLHKAIKLNDAQSLHLEMLKEKLFAAREQRIRPARDETILTSWNALMIQGLCAAYQATGSSSYLKAAQRAADFIQTNLSMPDSGLYRTWKEGRAKIPGFLDDYAFLANALLDLYESGFDKQYLDRAQQLVDIIKNKFWDDGLYFTPNDGEPLVHRPRAPTDNAWPSGLSSSLFAFSRLYELTANEDYRDRAEMMLGTYGAAAAKNPFAFAHFLAAWDFVRRSPLDILIVGDKNKANSLIESIHRVYLPAHVLAFADDVPTGEGKSAVQGQPTAYVCRQGTCMTPVTTAPALLKLCGL